ncbi:tRNase Z TRZ2 [Phytophthora citrophthora]|uniref:TRNase Z TRZ2 n=1 Tax=Phytophthora citrophthora TaxID=4793 RepID=A0AAD9GJ06_9STRA|nr:tRNase Z TRZ2 [Phytophthora citrophthora]
MLEILYEKKNRLKPEYQHLPGSEIAALKRAGQEITSAELTPEVAYTGDTTIEAFTTAANDGRSKDLFQVKLLITEATYADSKMTSQDAIDRGHMHIDQIADSDVDTLVLVHFSTRYSAEQLADCIQTRLPLSLQQKTILGC